MSLSLLLLKWNRLKKNEDKDIKDDSFVDGDLYSKKTINNTNLIDTSENFNTKLTTHNKKKSQKENQKS